MRVFVSLFGGLRDSAPADRWQFELEVGEAARVKDVLKALCISPQTPRVTLINGRPATDDTIAGPGDKLVFLSPLEGG